MRSSKLNETSCFPSTEYYSLGNLRTRLRVVSNFGDGDCGVGEIHTRARAKFREDATRGERQKFSPRVASSRNFTRARMCISPAPQSPSPKLDYLQSIYEPRGDT